MSTIEWLRAEDGSSGQTWNMIRARNKATGRVGWHCEHVHDGCALCYAERQNITAFRGGGTELPYKPGHRKDVDIFLDNARLIQPLGWKKPRRVFPCSMTDLFGDWVPDAWIDSVKAIEMLAPQHTYIELTKRPKRQHAYYQDPAWYARVAFVIGGLAGQGTITIEQGARASERLRALQASRAPLPNVWGGTSCSTQRDADAFLPILRDTNLAKRVVSFEPLLEAIWAPEHLGHMDWALLGLESGDPEEVRNRRRDLAALAAGAVPHRRHCAVREAARPPPDLERQGAPAPRQKGRGLERVAGGSARARIPDAGLAADGACRANADGALMSRHEIPAKDSNHKVIVGWDHPLLTYFAQVIDRRKENAGEDEKFVLWLGTSLREIYEVDQLERRIRRFAELTPDMGPTLYRDKDEGR
jgi:protein gp37